MAGTSSYAEEARKKVGQYLVKESGFSKKTPLKYYKRGENILIYVYLEKGFLTQVEVGITPLYIPDSIGFLNGSCLQNCAIPEDCGPVQANQWTESVIRELQRGILSFTESLASPQALLHYLTTRSSYDRRFMLNLLQANKLIIFTSAYLGDIPFAIEHAHRAMQEIRETRIKPLSEKIAQYDAEIAQINAMSQKTGTENLESIRQLIRNIEREREVAKFDLTHNAPQTIQMYEQWIAPLSAPDFDREHYFSQIIRQNKDSIKYEKLFKLKHSPEE